MKSEGGDVSLKVRFNVGGVKSILLSVSELEDSDWDLIISKRWGRYLMHAPTGKVVYLVRENGTYRLPPMLAKRAQGEDKAKVTFNSVIEKNDNKIVTGVRMDAKESGNQAAETRDDERFQWHPAGLV